MWHISNNHKGATHIGGDAMSEGIGPMMLFQNNEVRK